MWWWMGWVFRREMFFQLQQHPGELKRRPRLGSVVHLEQGNHVTQPRSQPLLSDQTRGRSALMSQGGHKTVCRDWRWKLDLNDNNLMDSNLGDKFRRKNIHIPPKEQASLKVWHKAETLVLLYPTPKIISERVTLPELCHHENAQWRQTIGGTWNQPDVLCHSARRCDPLEKSQENGNE